MRSVFIIFFIIFGAVQVIFAQKVNRMVSYYDSLSNHIKEEFLFYTPDSCDYTQYYHSGQVSIKGKYKRRVATGLWTYYFENGREKMKGSIIKNKPSGAWIYFYENGKIQKEGVLDGEIKKGKWRFYFENGKLKKEGLFDHNQPKGVWRYFYESEIIKAETFFKDSVGYYTGYFEEGGVMMKGKLVNGESDSTWNYYHPNGVLKASGLEIKGIKEGKWQFFDDQGNKISNGSFKKGIETGGWTYYHSGKVSHTGTYAEGKNDGSWKYYYSDGSLKGTGDFVNGDGKYIEYYPDGKLKIEGRILNNNYCGNWIFYSENGEIEGECLYGNGIGRFTGYFSNGKKKTEGVLINGEKVGDWILYKKNGNIAGYVKNIKEETANDDNASYLSEKIKHTKKKELHLEDDTLQTVVPAEVGAGDNTTPLKNLPEKRLFEFPYKSIIISANPMGLFVGQFPIYLEYYLDKNKGTEFLAIAINDPLIFSDKSLSKNRIWQQGGAMGLKQKYYLSSNGIGNPYYGHEFRYTYLKMSANTEVQETSGLVDRKLNATERLLEYTLLFGDRFAKDLGKRGYTMDVYLGFGIGYQIWSQSWKDNDQFDEIFKEKKRNAVSIPLRFGFSFGYIF